jgi:hypothetical protein
MVLPCFRQREQLLLGLPLVSLNLSQQSIPLDFGLPDCSLRLLSSVAGGGLPEQLLLFALEPEDVMLVLTQFLQVSCLFGDLAIFVFWDLVAILV